MAGLRNSKAGRPTTYNKKVARKAYELAKMGANEKEIASILEVNQRTLTRWKKDFPELCLAICNGKNDSIFEVKRSLFKRATGYKFAEVTKQKIKLDNGAGPDIPATVIKTVVKHMAPDVGACTTILKNNKAKEW